MSTFTTEEGIAAIKFLQGLADVPETDEQANRGWNSFSKHEKEFTVELYRRLNKSRQAKGIAQQAISTSPEAQQRRQHDLDRHQCHD